MELAEWAEGRWPAGREQQQVQPEKPDDGANRVEEFRFASEGGQEADRIKS